MLTRMPRPRPDAEGTRDGNGTTDRLSDDEQSAGAALGTTGPLPGQLHRRCRRERTSGPA